MPFVGRDAAGSPVKEPAKPRKTRKMPHGKTLIPAFCLNIVSDSPNLSVCMITEAVVGGLCGGFSAHIMGRGAVPVLKNSRVSDREIL